MMKTRPLPICLALLAACVVFPACRTTAPRTEARPLPAAIESTESTGEKTSAPIAPGVDYHHRLFANPFGDGPVDVHYLVIDWDETEKGFSFALANCGGTRRETSRMAGERQALAAVNGSFYETQDPSRPLWAMKVDGEVIPSISPGGAMAIAFDKGEMPVVEPFSKGLLERYDNVINGGDATKASPLPATATKAERRKARHPRTFVGLDTTNRVLVLAVADGRRSGSIGLTIDEEWRLIRPFGCDKGVNLDGGGSTTMVLRDATNAPAMTILNVPSDGKERRVCDALLLLDRRPLPAAGHDRRAPAE